MMRTGKRRESGNAALEFTLSSIPLIFVIVSVVQMSLGMWNYHTLNEAVNVTARTTALRGSDCASLSCAMTVGQVAQMITTKGIGLLSGSLNVTLTDANGSIACNPVTNCTSSSTVWPRSGGNSVGQVISISASYPFSSAISMFVPGRGKSSFASVTFSAISQQVIVY
ncbi:MAG TPA: TadE/TadG family type IV pilus assembly protein [Bryobacteraceae bacterium]|nr:TadE/TadG family type IV pilus assembly protein [Bryobacteraceae bacterium]